MTDYEKICSFDNLYKAHLRARLGKRAKNEVAIFEMNLAENIAKLSSDLTNRIYRMKGYYHFMIYEPKKRSIFAAHYPDRVVIHCICDEVLAPRIYPRLITDNAACQPGKGSHFALDRFERFLREYYREHGCDGYVLKFDIEKYFASIDHAVLKEKLKRILHDPDVLNLVFHYIDIFETEDKPGRGLPLGNQSSQCFAVYYLDSLDRLVKEVLKLRCYVRYMDDGVSVHHDRLFLERCLEKIREHVEGDLNLKLNGKTKIHSLKDGIDFLGWKFYITEDGRIIRKMRKPSKQRMKRRLGREKNALAEGRSTPEHARSCMVSYLGHLSHGDTYHLRQDVLREFAPLLMSE